MPHLFPAQATLSDVLSPQLPFGRSLNQTAPPKRYMSSAMADLYPAWSAVDDMKSKAGTLSEEAQREIQKASQAAQAKAGKIELYSPKYYAACTFGGLLACVSAPREISYTSAHVKIGCYTHCRDSIGFSKMPPSS